MKEQNFGKTTLKTTMMGLGLAALGRPGYINIGHQEDLERDYEVAAMEMRAHEMLDEAWTAGIRYFDVARSYGRAELFLASWLVKHQISPEEVTVGSKWGYTYTANWSVTAEKHEVKEHSAVVLERQAAESNALLSKYLKIYHIHSATIESGVLTNDRVLDQLAGLRSRHGWKIGLSLSGPQQVQTLQTALDVRRDGAALFESVQATWNLLETSAEPQLRAATDAGWGIIVKEAVGNGRLTARGTNLHPEISRVSRELNVSVDVIALAAALSRPWASVVLSGAAQSDHLQSNIKAIDYIDHPLIVDLIGKVSESHTRYWTIRSNLAWN
jgi:aryl-alcohol dehydrogenase-like predicted oxidoreductase